MSNAHLFRKLAHAQDQMMRATMPKAAEATDAPVKLVASIEQRMVAQRGGTRLMKKVA